jgi:hypothetical protein
MARSSDPLRRDTIAVTARSTGSVVTASRSNAALDLANALGDLRPEATKAALGVADSVKKRMETKAARDAIQSQGAELSTAVREGKLEATQNPYYIQAYNRESAGIRASSDISKLAMEAQSWEEKNDPAAFEARWRKESGELAGTYGNDIDSFAGFAPVEAQYTQQTLAANVSQNVARIKTERYSNLTSLGAQAIQQSYAQAGGKITPEQIAAALVPVRLQWVGTGGSDAEFAAMAKEIVLTAAESVGDKDLPLFLKRIDAKGNAINGAVQGDPLEEIVQAVVPESQIAQPPGKPAEDRSTTLQQTPAPLIRKPTGQRVTGPNQDPAVWLRNKAADKFLVQNTKDVAKEIFGSKVRLTSTKRPGDKGSLHSVNGTFDMAPIKGMSFQEAMFAIESKGYVLAEAIDETSAAVRAKTGGTGPHWHFAVATGGGATDIRPAPAFVGPGFQGGDQPFQAQAKQPLADGVSASIYDIAGNSSEIERAAGFIGERADRQRTEQVRIIEQTRKVKAFEASDMIFNKYGTRILTGDYTAQEIIQDLSTSGYSVPVISEALANLKGAQLESAGLANARSSWIADDPNTGKALMDLATEGRRDGYSPAYEDKVAQAVLEGVIDGRTGASLVDSALDRSDRDEKAAAAEERRGEKKASTGKVKSATQIKEGAKGFVLDFVGQTTQINRIRKAKGLPPVTFSEESVKKLDQRFNSVALRHLASNPGDYAGAYAAMQADVENATKNLLGR